MRRSDFAGGLEATTIVALQQTKTDQQISLRRLLVVQNELADRIRELPALPAALEPPGSLCLTFRRCRTCGLDRVGRGTELVRGDMRHHRSTEPAAAVITRPIRTAGR